MVTRIWGRCARIAAAAQFRRLSLESRAQLVEALLPDMTQSIHVNDRTLRFVVTTPLLLARANGLLTKEQDTIRWINGFPNNAVFWDVGANVGTYSLYAALEGERTIVAFEPSASNYAVLCENIRINELRNARAYCLAFARETRLGVLNLSSSSIGAAVNQFGDEGDASRYAEGLRRASFSVQGSLGLSMDDFIARVQPPFPNFIKVDVDGIELPIFEGAEKTLRDTRLQSLLAELTISDDAEYSKTLAFLAHCGFEVAGKGEVQTAGGHFGRNHIFVRTQKPR